MKLTTRQKAALSVLSPGFGGTTIPDYIKTYLENGLGAITLFGSNTPDLESTAKLVREIRALNPDCVISIDEEAGDVTRIWAKSGSPFPSPFLLGRIDEPDLTEAVYRQLGAYLALADIDVTFGPVLDLVVNAENPIVGVRSFGADSARVAVHGSAAVRGLGLAGICSTPKHFPGHGKTSDDSHHDLPLVLASLQELLDEDFQPFLKVIQEGVKAIMVGHLLVPAVDSKASSLSAIWFEEILRRRLGFQGVIVTDALDMGALGGVASIDSSSIQAIKAGANLLCLSGLADQSQIIQRIIALAEKELTEPDLEKIQFSKEKIATLRRDRKVEAGIESINPDQFSSGFEIQGNLKLGPGSIAVLSLEASPTIASGHISWGLEASFSELGLSLGGFDTADNKIVQFRDVWRDPVILDRLLMLKENHPSAIFVDFGWPTQSFKSENLLKAFGASKAHSDAIARLLLN